MMMNTIFMGATGIEPYVAIFSKASVIQVILHAITLLVTLGLIVMCFYVLVLAVKALKKAIKLMDKKLEEVESRTDE